MNIVLLSGGSGKRLWPISNDVRSKQFIKIFKTENGGYESMVQRVYRQICEVDSNSAVTIAAPKTQISIIRNQLGDNADICIEPCRRDTFPAIALVTAYLHDIKGISENEAVVVCPVDSYVDNDYFKSLKSLIELAEKGSANLVLMGIEPTSPSEKYGYIIPDCNGIVSNVNAFKEKPSADIAKDYIKQGALWNCGVFAYKLKYVLEKAHQLIDFTDYQDLFSKYDSLEKISFDYAIVENEPKTQVMRFARKWKDLGTWNTLTESMEDSCVGKAILNEACENVHVINDLDVPVLCMGLKNIIVSVGHEGILVSDKEQSDGIKPFVDQIDQQTMFAEKSWGNFRVIDADDESMTVKIKLNPNQRMNYHSHKRRNEVWTIISGKGRTIVNGTVTPVKAGDVITMQAGCRHTIIADTEINLIEIQLGKEISIHDKQKFELEI